MTLIFTLPAESPPNGESHRVGPNFAMNFAAAWPNVSNVGIPISGLDLADPVKFVFDPADAAADSAEGRSGRCSSECDRAFTGLPGPETAENGG